MSFADQTKGRQSEPATGLIEIELRQVSQLFNTLDPSPFRDSDLDREAEEYIVDGAMDLPKKAPIEIVIYLPSDQLSQVSAVDISRAVKNYFAMRVREASSELHEKFKTGRLSLLIGLLILSACFLIGLFLYHSFKEGPFAEIVRESFVIFGWVAIWKPSEIFLYEWPPIARRRKLFRRLAEATVTVNTAA